MKYVIVFMFFCSLFYSCKKDVAIPIQKIVKTNSASSVSYMPLKVGNYWIYYIYDQDTTGLLTFFASDSIYIHDSITSGGITAYNFLHSGNLSFGPGGMTFPCQINDSASFLFIGNGRGAFLDPVHLNDTVRAADEFNLARVYTIPMIFSNDTVPAGVFSGITMNDTIHYYNPNPHYNGTPHFINYTKFSPNTGIIEARVSFLSNPTPGIIWKLIRYHV